MAGPTIANDPVLPYNNINNFNPTDLASGPPSYGEPTSLVGGMSAGFRSAVAAGADHYQVRMQDEYNALASKLEAAGVKKPPVLPMFSYDENRVSNPEFQSLMNENAPVLPGDDERFKTQTAQQDSMRKWLADTNDLVTKARTARPDMNIEYPYQIHQRVMQEIAQDRNDNDAVTGWRGYLGQFLGGMASMTAFRSDPWAPAKIVSLGLGGIGPNVATRMATLGALNAAINVLPELGGRATLSQAGVPITDQDMAMEAAMGFAGGLVFGGIDELALGSAGRAAKNDSFSWMKLSTRDSKLGALKPTNPDNFGYSQDFWNAKPPPEPTAPVQPPRAPIPSGVPGAIEQLGTTPPEDVFSQMAGAPAAYIPKAQRAPTTILNNIAKTLASRQRAAEDLDMMSTQLEGNLTIQPQEAIPPTRPMSPNATTFPEVRTQLGPTAGMVPDLPPNWARAAASHSYNIEDVARSIDPETWAKWDQIQTDLAKAQADLDRVTHFHADTVGGGTAGLDKHIVDLTDQFARSPSSATRNSILQQIDETKAYHTELRQTRAGGTPPEAPKSLDVPSRVERVAKIQAKRDALFQDVERSVARSEGLWGMQVEDAKAFEEKMRPGAADRISQPWRWPNGVRPKGMLKNPYEVTLLKGPTTEELLAKRKAQFDQQSDPVANDPKAPPSETPIQTATRVNTTNYETKGKADAEAFYKQVTDFAKTLEKKGPSTPLPQAGQFEAIGTGKNQTFAYRRADNAVFQAKAGEDEKGLLDRLVKEGKLTEEEASVAQKNDFLPSSTMQRLWKEGAFEFDGKAMNLKEAMDEIASDQEAFKSFSSCIAGE